MLNGALFLSPWKADTFVIAIMGIHGEFLFQSVGIAFIAANKPIYAVATRFLVKSK